MLFDNKETTSNRLVTTNPINEDYTSSAHQIISNISTFNESFYMESQEILLRETFARTRNNFLFMNESVDEFITKFESIANGIIEKSDKIFDKFAKNLASKYMDDAKFIDEYRDEFMSVQNVSIKVHEYTIDDSIPNFIVLNQLKDSSFDVNIARVDVSKLKSFKKEAPYYDTVRANVIGIKNKKVKEDKFKEECYKAFRNGSKKKVVKELTPELKLRILQDIASCEQHLREVRSDLDTIKAFIRMNIKNTVNQFNFVSNHTNISKYEYDAYTSFIYNKLDEMRNLIKIYQYVMGYKMDAIEDRRKEYTSIFKNTITHIEYVNESYCDILSEDAYEYELDTDELSEALFSVGLDLECTNLTSFLYSEEINLINEGVVDTLQKVIRELLNKVPEMFNKFANKATEDFNGIYNNENKHPNRADFEKMDLSKFQRKIFSYNKNIGLMKSTISAISNAKLNQGQIEKIEEIMKDVNTLRKNTFGTLYQGYKEGDDWGEHVKSKLRGPEITVPSQVISDVYDYCENTTYTNNRKALTACRDSLTGTLRMIDAEIKKVKANTNTTADNKAESVNLLAEEGEGGIAEQNKDNADLQKGNLQRAEQEASVNKDDYSDTVKSANGDAAKLQAMKAYFKELQSVQGYVWAIFEEGRAMYIKYLATIIAYQNAKKAKGKIKEKMDKKKEGNKQEGMDLFDATLNVEYLRNKIINESSLNEVSDNLLHSVLHLIMEQNNLEEKMRRDILVASESGFPLDKTIQGYTNIFSNKLNVIIKDRDSILYK